MVEEIRDCDETVLSEFLLHSIRTVCRYLQIGTPIARTSDFEGNGAYRRQERIYDLCRRLGADTYINPIGGVALYDFAKFRQGDHVVQRWMRWFINSLMIHLFPIFPFWI